MGAQWPKVVDWLIVTLPTLSGWDPVSVFDGPPVTGDNPSIYVTVGYVQDDVGGSYSQVQDPSGFQWQETGEVRCKFVCNSGDDDLSVLRATAFSLADTFEASVRADRTLGGTLAPASDVSTAVEVLSVQNATGAAQEFVFTLHYFTVT